MKLSDIAQLAGVSLTTASYVINGKAEQRRISAATVARVMAVVEAHGYQPDQRAAGLRRGATHTLGFLLPDLENPSYARLAKQLERRARARGYQLLIACTDDNPDSERQLIALFRARRCDGLFTASSLAEDDGPYRQLQEHSIPIIAIDRQLDPTQFCSVVSDDHAAGRQLTATLLTPDTHSIALIGARPDLVISRERAAGFAAALVDHPARHWERHAPHYSRDGGRAQAQAMIEELGHWPEALLTTSYVLLQGVLDVLRDHPLAKDKDLRLATFGDTQLLDYLPFKVNAISQQHELITERALELMLDALENDSYLPGVRAIPRVLKRRLP